MPHPRNAPAAPLRNVTRLRDRVVRDGGRVHRVATYAAVSPDGRAVTVMVPPNWEDDR